MNTTEKRKLEVLLTSKLTEAREAYKNRRAREHNALVAKFEKNYPQKIKQLIAKRDETLAEYSNKIDDCEKRIQVIREERERIGDKKSSAINSIHDEAKKLGYRLYENYANKIDVRLDYETTYVGRYSGTAVRTYNEPTLSAHDEETQKKLQSLDDMASEYTVKIWSESDDMSNILTSFYEQVGKLVA